MYSEYDPTDIDQANELEAAREESAKILIELERLDLIWLMSEKEGRRFMWRLLSFTGAFRNPYTGDNTTFFKCGMMNVGQKYLGDIHQYCPDLYNIMVKEQQNDGSTEQHTY